MNFHLKSVPGSFAHQFGPVIEQIRNREQGLIQIRLSKRIPGSGRTFKPAAVSRFGHSVMVENPAPPGRFNGLNDGLRYVIGGEDHVFQPAFFQETAGPGHRRHLNRNADDAFGIVLLNRIYGCFRVPNRAVNDPVCADSADSSDQKV